MKPVGVPGFFDYDNDGDLDLYIACGHIDPPTWEMPGGQEDIFLQNSGDGTFIDVSKQTGVARLGKMLGRGTAFGDYDQDSNVFTRPDETSKSLMTFKLALKREAEN